MDKQETTMTTFTIKSRPTALALAAAFATMTMLASSASAKPAHASGASVSGSRNGTGNTVVTPDHITKIMGKTSDPLLLFNVNGRHVGRR
jgi:hypothetical protein